MRAASIEPQQAAGEFPNLSRHHNRMLAREAIRGTMEVEAAIGYELPPDHAMQPFLGRIRYRPTEDAPAPSELALRTDPGLAAGGNLPAPRASPFL